MTAVARRILLRAVLGAAAVSGAAGCVHDAHTPRILQIRTFEAGYFESLRRAAYDEAYASLHTELKSLLPEERYRAYFTVLTDTLGPMTSWRELASPMDRRLALFDPRRRWDPLPPTNPKKILEARYRLQFATGAVTVIIQTGWDNGRMVIRKQILCCADPQTVSALRVRAVALGVGELFGVKPAGAKPAPQAPPPAPDGTAPGGPAPTKP